MCTSPFFPKIPNTIEFFYDDAGNRISRSVPIVMLSRSPNSQNENVIASKEEILEYNISVYPNPTIGEVNLSITGKSIDDRTELSLYNTSGSLIYKEKVIDETTRVDLSNNPNGVYLLHLLIGGQVVTWKVIKR